MWTLQGLILAVALVGITPCLSSQQQTTPKFEKSPPLQNPLPTAGQIVDGTYKNASIGLEFTPAKNLHLEAPEMKGEPGTVPLNITIQAMDDRDLVPDLSSVRSLTSFSADSLAYYPLAQRNAASYLKMLVRANETAGFRLVDGARSEQMNGISFLRADFAKKPVRETVLVAIHNEYAFVFIFAGADAEVTKELIASTHVKFIP